MTRGTKVRCMNSVATLALALAAPGVGLLAGAAHAETVASAAAAAVDAGKGLRVEEVIVTAQRREQSAQTVPIAITAIAGELKNADVRDLSDLVAYTPNVRIDPSPQRAGAPSITIRGVSAVRNDDNSLESPIGVFIDGVYLGTLPGQNVENFDLQRIEVLRGPQGTLFGRNTVAGALNVIRTQPTGEWGANVQYTTGSWNDQEFRGVFNAPLIKDKLALKLFFISENRDGFVHNTFLNINQPQKNYKNYGGVLKFTPNDNFKALLTVERFDDRTQGGAFLANENTSADASTFLPGTVKFLAGLFGDTTYPGVPNVPVRATLGVPSTISGNLPNPGHVDTYAVTLNMSYKLNDNLKLVSITGYRHQHEMTSFDFDASSDNFINIATDAHYHQISEELRAEGSWDTKVGKINLTAGGFYYNNYFNRGWTTSGDFWNVVESLSGISLADDTWLPAGVANIFKPAATNPLFASAFASVTGAFADPVSACLAPRPAGSALATVFGQVVCDPGVTGAYGQGTLQKLYETQGTDSFALFGHGEWEFYPHLTLTAGVRWTYEKKNFVGYQSYLAPVSRANNFDFPSSTGVLSRNWTQVTPTVALSYQATPDVLIYGSFSEGWHSGGFFGVNQNVSDFSKTYNPESSRSFEGGIKSQFLDHRVQLNLTGFVDDFHNKQESSIELDQSTNTVVTVFTNVGGARYEGIEAELQWVVSHGLRLSGAAGYLHAKYTSLLIGFPQGGPVTDASNLLVPRTAPKWTLGGNASYTIPVGPGDLQLETKVTWVDSEFGDLYNTQRAPAHTDVSASVSYAFKSYKVTAFGRNLTSYQNVFVQDIGGLFGVGTYGPPASWGLELAAKF